MRKYYYSICNRIEITAKKSPWKCEREHWSKKCCSIEVFEHIAIAEGKVKWRIFKESKEIVLVGYVEKIH